MQQGWSHDKETQRKCVADKPSESVCVCVCARDYCVMFSLMLGETSWFCMSDGGFVWSSLMRKILLIGLLVFVFSLTVELFGYSALKILYLKKTSH